MPPHSAFPPRPRASFLTRDPHLNAFRSALRASGSNLGDLARRARIGRSALSQILAGSRCGRQSWKHILPCLTEPQLFHLKQSSVWNACAQSALDAIEASRALPLFDTSPAAKTEPSNINRNEKHHNG